MHCIVRFFSLLLIGSLLTAISLVSLSVTPLTSSQAHAGFLDTVLESSDERVPYCNDPAACGLEAGKNSVGNGLTGINTTDKKFVDYVQEIIIYFIGFLSLVSLILFLYAGWLVVSSAGNEDNIKKAKGIFKYVIIGVLIIFLSYAITRFIFGDSTGKGILTPTTFNFINSVAPDASAASSKTFSDYRSDIEKLVIEIDKDIQVNGKVKIVFLQELNALVASSLDTLPNNNDSNRNKALNENVLAKIAVLKKNPSSDVDSEKLAIALKEYLDSVKIGKITAKITATPHEGNAPLSVTLRAVEAKDPSGTQIPNSNYVWWLRTSGGAKKIIGTGPSILYRFDTEAVYSVNLEIRSSSKNQKGNTDVLPFSGVQEIKVLPKLANILLYVNGANVSNVETYKITPSVGRAGVLIDATSSSASPGATIVKTEWDFGNGEKVIYNGSPKLERRVYSIEGAYTVKLSITTNESPQPIVRELRILSQDPIASIRAEKTVGFAGEEFKFQATSNIGNGLFRFEWVVLESDGGKVLFTSKSQAMNYKFPRMGFYTVKLKTTSAGGKEDTDNVNIRIDSRDPTANFEVKALSSELPNIVTIDATRSYDPDSKDASKLNFSWTIDGERIELDNSQRNGSIGQFMFTTKGTHSVVLDLTNEQGKVTQLQKEFVVNSLLSVKLVLTPKIAQLGNEVVFVAESKEATVFEWDYGDGVHENTSEARVFHTYKAAGVYSVKLTVRGNQDAGNSNTISRTVYISEADTPFAGISVKRESDLLETTPDVCSGNEAFVVDRSKPLQFSAGDSINTDGTTSGLNYSWKYLGKNSTQRDFSLKIDELGCFPITLTVRSQKINKEHTITKYVKVENALPTFAGLSVSADKLEADPVVVNVSVNNPSDPDGVIVSYLWYYYTDSDPEPQDFRITRTPKSTFVVPRINGKYYFAVTMEDSNGAKLNSEEGRDERYSITLASDNINTPLITLKTSKSEAKVAEEITFQATVKNVLGQDLTEKAEYKWDFDGDGFYDKTTAVPTVTYKFDTPGSYNMKVKAGYKGVSNTRYQQITVRNALEPSLEYFAVGNKFIFMNTTVGAYKSAKWKLGNSSSDNLRNWTVTLDEGEDPGEVELEVSDGLNTKSTTVKLTTDTVNAKKISASKDDIVILSYPGLENGVLTIKNQNDPAYIYLGESKSAEKYVIDLDTKVDSDLNGDPADDVDNSGTDSHTSGAPFYLTNLDKQASRTVRVKLLDANGKSIATSDFKLVLSYVDTVQKKTPEVDEKSNANISDEDKKSIALLKDLVKTTAPEGKRVAYMQYISQMVDEWGDENAKTKTIIDFQQAIGEDGMSQSDKDKFLTVLDGFLMSDSEVKDEIGLAVSVLKKLIPQSNTNYEEMFGKDGKGGIVAEILSHPTQLDENRKLGEKMLGYIKTDVNISDDDKLILKEQIKLIIYGGSKNMPAEAVTPTKEGSSSMSDMFMNILYIFGGIIALIVVIFILLFTFFKLTSKNPEQGFQDFIIENIFGSGGPKPPTKPAPPMPSGSTQPLVQKEEVSSTPVAPIAVQSVSFETSSFQAPVENTPTYTPKNDIFAAVKSQNEEVSSFSSNTFQSTDKPVITPQNPSVEEVENTIPEYTASLPESDSVTASSDGIPDWLKGAMPEVSVNDSQPAIEANEASIVDSPSSDSIEVSTRLEETSSDSGIIPELKQDTVPVFSLDDESLENMAKGIDTRIPPPPKKSTSTLSGTQNGVNTADLPDWLKGMGSTTEEEIIPQEVTSPSETVTVPESVIQDVSVPESSFIQINSESSQVKNLNEPVPQTKSAEVVEKKVKKTQVDGSKNIGQPKTSLNEIAPTVTTDDLPDWLK